MLWSVNIHTHMENCQYSTGILLLCQCNLLVYCYPRRELFMESRMSYSDLLCVCGWVCVWCARQCVCACVRACLHACVWVSEWVSEWVCVCVCVCVCVMCMAVCVCVCMCACACVHACVCVYFVWKTERLPQHVPQAWFSQRCKGPTTNSQSLWLSSWSSSLTLTMVWGQCGADSDRHVNICVCVCVCVCVRACVRVCVHACMCVFQEAVSVLVLTWKLYQKGSWLPTATPIPDMGTMQAWWEMSW